MGLLTSDVRVVQYTQTELDCLVWEMTCLIRSQVMVFEMEVSSTAVVNMIKLNLYELDHNDLSYRKVSDVFRDRSTFLTTGRQRPHQIVTICQHVHVQHSGDTFLASLLPVSQAYFHF